MLRIVPYTLCQELIPNNIQFFTRFPRSSQQFVRKDRSRQETRIVYLFSRAVLNIPREYRSAPFLAGTPNGFPCW